MEQKRILIIEDEKRLSRLIELELHHAQYDAKAEYDGKHGLQALQTFHPDLVLLDLMLPDLDGIEICRRICASSAIPVIMLTAKADTTDKVAGLDAGANDYITKPFAFSELLARIRAALRVRASNEKSSQTLSAGNLSIDLTKHTVVRDNVAISLTKTEFELLQYMTVNSGVVLNREQILNAVWGIDYEGEANIVDVYIRYLRSKIDEPFPAKLIHTVRGYGYVLEDRSSDTQKAAAT